MVSACDLLHFPIMDAPVQNEPSEVHQRISRIPLPEFVCVATVSTFQIAHNELMPTQLVTSHKFASSTYQTSVRRLCS